MDGVGWTEHLGKSDWKNRRHLHGLFGLSWPVFPGEVWEGADLDVLRQCQPAQAWQAVQEQGTAAILVLSTGAAAGLEPCRMKGTLEEQVEKMIQARNIFHLAKSTGQTWTPS